MINPLRYRGYYYDSETGMYYLQSRYYDPETGRFINVDGLVSTGGFLGFNMFAYCKNNPVMLSDPSGCKPGDWYATLDEAKAAAQSYYKGTGTLWYTDTKSKFVTTYVTASIIERDALWIYLLSCDGD